MVKKIVIQQQNCHEERKGQMFTQQVKLMVLSRADVK